MRVAIYQCRHQPFPAQINHRGGISYSGLLEASTNRRDLAINDQDISTIQLLSITHDDSSILKQPGGLGCSGEGQ
jgi:hypothetical protein